MYIERQISYLHSQVSLAAYKLHKSGARNNFRRSTVLIYTFPFSCSMVYHKEISKTPRILRIHHHSYIIPEASMVATYHRVWDYFVPTQLSTYLRSISEHCLPAPTYYVAQILKLLSPNLGVSPLEVLPCENFKFTEMSIKNIPWIGF